VVVDWMWLGFRLDDARGRGLEGLVQAPQPVRASEGTKAWSSEVGTFTVPPNSQEHQVPNPLATIRTWRSVLAQPRVAAVFVSSGIARLARASVPLAVVLVVAETSGSYAWAGATAAVLTVTDAATAPIKGWLADRYGRARVLLPGAAVYATSLVALAAATDPHQAWTLGAAATAGIGFPPISGSVKALLPLLLGDAHLRAAYVVESTVQQVLFFAGPLYVAVTASIASEDVALYGAAATLVAGSTGLVLAARTTSGDRRDGARRLRGPGALAIPIVRILTCTTLVQSIIFGANGVTVPAAAAAAGAPNTAGLVLATGPIGGLLGGLLITTSGARPYTRYIRLLLIAAGCYAPMTVLPLPALTLCLFAGGLVVTPLAAICYLLLSDAVPTHNRTEAFTWLSTAVATGGAIGAGLAGLTIDHLGVHPALTMPMIAALAGALIATPTRHHAIQDPTLPKD
jgi:MFS family permease